MDEEIYHLYHREEDDWWWSAGRRALVRSLWRRFGPAGGRPRILELGCGTGGLLKEISSWGEIHGLDMSWEAVSYCRARGLSGICQGRLGTLPYRDGVFDLVIAVDVLEHLDDDERAAREISRVLRPGGLLIATVPAFQFLWSRRDEQLHHRRRYTRSSFRSLIEGAGLMTARATYVNPQLFLPLVLLVALGRRKPGGHTLRVDYGLVPGPMNRLMTLLAGIEARLVARLPLPIGTSIALVSLNPADRSGAGSGPAGDPQNS